MAERRTGRVERPYNWRRVEKPTSSRRSRGSVRLVLAVPGVIILLALAAFGYFQYKVNQPQNASADPVLFAVHTGDTDSSIANRLQRLGLLHDSFFFSLEARLDGMGAKLQVGVFSLRKNMSINSLISTLSSGRARLIQVTIPAGLRVEEVAAILQHDGISGKQFLQAARKRPHLGFSAGIPARAGAEGFLFPDTYSVAPGTTGAAFEAQMVSQFARTFTPAMRAVARREHRSVFRIVKMASIIEREAGIPSDRPKVASVYYNRLHAHYYLQSDPTVQYALGRAGKWWPLIGTADYQSTNSPYNTFKHLGLPPGPICNPGLGSILAALHPAHTSYFYFSGVRNSPRLLFATTYAQFLQNVHSQGG
ncbi:MAG TPA: endolytic transglycosylase MltG [Chloroflexota bacterium]|nr:endolytic transglycosylase MltG [Chloroflexota bacterium]